MKRCQLALFLEGNRVDDLRAAFDTLRANGMQSAMILACGEDDWPQDALSVFLQSLDLPVFGGIFPRIIHAGRLHRHGTVIVGFAVKLEIAVVSRLGERSGIEPQLQRLAPLLENARSLIALVDGLSANLEALVECLYGVTGVRVPVTGGGAGHLDLVQRPCLITNAGVLDDSAVLVAMPWFVDRGISHGWQVLAGPFLVTKSQGNILRELNYCSAYDTYRSEVEAHTEASFSNTDFFSIAKTFPLGIESVDGEFLVRDPIKAVGDALVCVGEVPENAAVYLLKGEAAGLIAAAAEAATSACSQRALRLAGEPADAPLALVFDCISRVLFLDDAFADELNAIGGALPDAQCMIGALTLGEIASSRRGLIELMNKSTLVSLY